MMLVGLGGNNGTTITGGIIANKQCAVFQTHIAWLRGELLCAGCRGGVCELPCLHSQLVSTWTDSLSEFTAGA